MSRLSLFLIAAASIPAHSTELISVPISFQEALAPTDTTSSSRFQKEYDSAIRTGKTLLADSLKKCGYQIQHSTEFYEASDPLQARERAAKAERNDAWLIVGPRRSNHYLLTAQGAEATPSVSLMANSGEVFSLGPIHLTMGLSNGQIAKALVKTSKAHLKRPNFSYVTIVNADCVFCLDLAFEFDKVAGSLKKLKEIRVVGDTPDLKKITAELGTLKPDVVLLPNYSKPSGVVMAGLNSILPNTLYLGGDGWGTNSFGYVQNGPDLKKVIAYTARGSIPSEDALATFKTGRQLLKNPSAAKQFPDSNSALAILKILDGLSDILCTSKPKTKADFVKAFHEHGAKYMQPSWGIGVYKLENSNLRFYRSESI